jgi:hypothetical protein
MDPSLKKPISYLMAKEEKVPFQSAPGYEKCLCEMPISIKDR